MSHLELVQGSDEWRAARRGSVGASQIADVVARTRTGYGASRANLAAQIIVERLTGVSYEGYVNAAMTWGIETEPQARSAYEFYEDVEVQQVGLFPHPHIDWTHASPDGLVGADGLLECKCPQSAAHIETLLEGKFPERYILQVQWQMCCTGRSWADLMSFDPRLPERMRMKIIRVRRDDEVIGMLEKEVAVFLDEIEDKIAALEGLYPQAKAA